MGRGNSGVLKRGILYEFFSFSSSSSSLTFFGDEDGGGSISSIFTFNECRTPAAPLAAGSACLAAPVEASYWALLDVAAAGK